ncbi:MAG TPA: hypothetical protein VF701_08550 [Thermoanaerobaculia bacterium]
MHEIQYPNEFEVNAAALIIPVAMLPVPPGTLCLSERLLCRSRLDDEDSLLASPAFIGNAVCHHAKLEKKFGCVSFHGWLGLWRPTPLRFSGAGPRESVKSV